MKIGAIIIHSSKYTQRKIYVDGLVSFFKDTDVEVNIIEGVFTDHIYNDARDGLHDKIITKGSSGCSLANKNAYELALQKGYDYVFIFEDDARVMAPNYDTLKEWINRITVNYDVLLLTNVGTWVGTGHDGRIHYKTQVSNDLYKASCIFGTQAYYLSKDIVKILYDTQMSAISNNRIYVADGLLIHCEKSPGVFLDIITPINTNMFFMHEGYNSITAHVDSLSK